MTASYPLAGVRVLELGHWVAGPFCSVFLRDLGADVVKLEPLGGEPMRNIETSAFLSSNRGKRMVAADLKSEGGQAIVKRATEWADVVTHNFRPGVAARLGVDAQALRLRKPSLIVLETSAYGSVGPRATQAGFDTLLQAAAGHFTQISGAGNDPMTYRFAHVDHATGLLGTLAVVSALYHRQQREEGSTVAVDLYSTAVFMLSELVREENGSFTELSPVGEHQTGSDPTESLYRATDGWIAIAASDHAAVVGLAELVGLTVRGEGRSAQWPPSGKDKIASFVSARTIDENREALRPVGVWVEACVSDGATAFAEDRGMRQAGTALVTHDEQYGERVLVGPGFSFTESDLPSPAERGYVGELGEQTEQFLSELGFDLIEIQQLRLENVIL